MSDTLEAGGGAEDAAKTRVRCAWSKYNELIPILTLRGVSLKTKGKLYEACVQNVLVYGSETWPLKAEDLERLARTERSMVRWMYGVSLRVRRKSEELQRQLGIVMPRHWNQT